MKKTLIYVAASMIAMVSCQKTVINNIPEDGYLSFGGFSLDVDEEVITKADPASGTYSIKIYDSEENLVKSLTYAQVKENNDKISLPAGTYTLTASSDTDEVPAAIKDHPIYGTSTQFSITAGEVTEIQESLVCTLQQCKVTVAYSDDFLESITGAGETTVEVTSGHPISFALNADGTYDETPGYFAVGEGSTMTVIFKGSVDGKTAKMTKTFSGIAAKQWRKIKFVQKKNEQGQATFDIEINDLISDAVLNNNVGASEEVIGEDPDAPKGDGGITLDFDYEAGCDSQLTDLANMLIVPVSERKMAIKLKANIPNGILKFTVEVQSTSTTFNSALEAAGGALIDLINPSPANDIIFQVVPFPHGADLVGQKDVAFDLSAAQEAIVAYPGSHTFLMTIVDQTFCTKKIPVTMIVE